MKIAVLADLHLPDNTEILQWQVLDAALKCCAVEGAELLVLAGDMIQAGAASAAKVLAARIAESALPVVATLGNTEMATPDFAENAPFPAAYCSGNLSVQAVEAASAPIAGRVNVRVGHWPAEQVPDGVTLQIGGHLHRDIDNGRMQTVRGLDPDKVIEGPPCVTFFNVENDGSWKRYERNLPGFSVDEWSAAERKALLEQLGVSFLVDLHSELERAMEAGIRKVEIRCSLLNDPDAVRRYIREMNGTVSVHLTEISFENPDYVLDYVRRGVDAGASRFTLHVPSAPVAVMNDERNFETMLTHYCRVLEIAPDAIFGIENMHMCPGELPDDSRRYGYLPAEQLRFINALRQRMPQAKLGGVIDVGHCRNNAPFTANNSLSQWFAALRGNVVTMHLHQVSQNDDGSFRNHTWLTGWYKPLISLASFINEWKRTRFGGAALFIECRGGWEETYRMFRNALEK